MTSVKVSKKGWVVIPKEIRERRGIRPGDHVHFVEMGNKVILVRAYDDPIAAGSGFLKGPVSMTDDLLEERRKELDQEERGLPPPQRDP